MGRSWKNFEKHDRKILHWFGQIVDRSIGVKHSAREGSGGSQGHGKESLNYLREFICHHRKTFVKILYPLHFLNIDKSKCNSKKMFK